MKRFLAILIGATSCSLCTYAQNGYIVTTTSQQTSISVESLEKQFINDGCLCRSIDCILW